MHLNREDTCGTCGCFSLPPYLHSQCSVSTEFSEPAMTESSARLEGSASLACFTYDSVLKGMQNLNRTHFLSEPELTLSAERWDSNEHNCLRNPIISFCIHIASLY